jgi:hypothetical protein
MIRANPIASARKEDCRDDSCNVDTLHECEKRVVSKYAIDQKESAGNKPD